MAANKKLEELAVDAIREQKRNESLEKRKRLAHIQAQKEAAKVVYK